MAKWKEGLLLKLSEQREEGRHCDTQISTNDGGCLNAHVCVLAATSAMLNLKFSDTVSVKRLHLPFTKATVKLALDFIYQGTLTIPLDVNIINELHTFSVSLEITELANICLKIQTMIEQIEWEATQYDMNKMQIVIDDNNIEIRSPDKHITDNKDISGDNDHSDCDSLGDVLLTRHVLTEVEDVTPMTSEYVQETKLLENSAMSTENKTTETASLNHIEKPDNPEEFPDHLKAFAPVDGEKKGIIHSCVFCKKKFRTRTKFFTHMRDHHPVPGMIRCGKCLKDFTSFYELRKHKFKEHWTAIKKQYNCDVCGEIRYSSSEMKYHMTAHTGERPYHCKYCDRKFRNQTGVDVHQRTHTGEKPYACKICGKTFASQSNRFSHEKRCHKMPD